MNKSISYTDLQLIDLCLAGQEIGYSKLYEKYVKQIYNSIARLVVDDSVAEELTQEFFISIFSDVEKLKEITYLGAWFKRIAINKAISHLRKKKMYFSEIDAVQDELCDELDDEITLRKEMQVAEIMKCIDQLSTENRTIVNLFLFEELSHEEIGNMLGISSSTVRSKYHRAKKKIVESLQVNYYE